MTEVMDLLRTLSLAWLFLVGPALALLGIMSWWAIVFGWAILVIGEAVMYHGGN